MYNKKKIIHKGDFSMSDYTLGFLIGFFCGCNHISDYSYSVEM